MEKSVVEILRHFDVDLSDPNFKDTPTRYKKALEELLGGSKLEPPNMKKFPIQHPGEIVFIGGLKATSLCPHHLCPYTMEACFEYLPDKFVVGISKPGRLLEWLSKRFGIQECIGPAFLKIFMETIKPHGGMILIKGVHLCTTIRGAKQDTSTTTTVASDGVFKWDNYKRGEFYELVRGGARES